jgi:hypothetical protein
MTIEVYRRNAEGRLQLDPRRDATLRETITVDLKVPPNPDVRLWAGLPAGE